jgi:hypothetical protein
LQAAYDEQATQTSANETDLQAVIQKIEELQHELDDRSFTQSTATGPTARARKAVAAVKEEVACMDVNIGVSRQQLFHLHWKLNQAQKV